MRRTMTTTCLAAMLVVGWPTDDATAPTSYADAVQAIVRAEREGQWEEAVAGAQTLLDEADARGLSEYQRAEVHFATGVVLARRDVEEPEELRQALPPFEAARALAGPGELRLDAGYDLGVTELQRAERLRLRVPEIAGQPMAMAAPPAPGADEETDPLEDARAGYLAAKERLLDRLRADWRDEDTRANLELIQRRLRELDEIEKRREEQEQPEDPQDGESGDESEGKPDENQEGENESESSESEETEGEGESEEESEGEGQEGEQETEAIETEPGEDQAGPEEPVEGQPSERRLTKEEVLRLLQALEDIEERGENVRRILNEAQREQVKRDW